MIIEANQTRTKEGVSMEYSEILCLKDGRTCRLRNGVEQDAQGALSCFLRTHEQTDYLLSLPEEITLTLEKEGDYLKARQASPDEIELVAEVDGQIVGLAGIDRVGRGAKVRHRAHFGISIDRAWWGLGIGWAMVRACVQCAKRAGYRQVELEVVAENQRAVALYRSEGFVEYGRNPQGFCSTRSGCQEVILMRRTWVGD